MTEPTKSFDEMLEEMRKHEQAERRRAHIASLLKSAGMPDRFVNATFEDLELHNDSLCKAVGAMRDFAEHFADYRANGRSVLLLGPTGLAKTHMACAAIRHLCMAGRSARFTNFGEAVKRIRNSWRREALETELDVLEDLRSPDLLVIDEVGVQNGTESEQNHAFDIINGRYSDMKPTIVISNTKPDGVIDFLGHRVVDRLLENNGLVIELTGPSYRQRRGAA